MQIKYTEAILISVMNSASFPWFEHWDTLW